MNPTIGDMVPWMREDPRYASVACLPHAPSIPPAMPSRHPDDGRITVGLLCSSLVAGGAEAQQLAIARHADPSRIDFVGCCLVSGPSDPGMIEATRSLMPVTFGLHSARNLATRADVLIGWGIGDYRPIAGGTGARVVGVSHVPAEARWDRVEGVDRWVAVSELAVGAIPACHRRDARVVWNCVDRDRLTITRDRATMRRLWGVPEGARVAGYLGRLAPEKDPLAMRRLAGDLPAGWVAVAVGDGPLRDQLGGVDGLVVVGADLGAGDVLDAYDCLIVPSRYESFGLTLAEGLVMGLPVVSTDVGLARMVPGITTPIPHGADGPTIAAAILAATSRPAPPRVAELIPRLGSDRFGREWTAVIASAATRAGITTREALDLVARCESRGNVLPLSMQADCGCQGRELSECRAGKGIIAGRVTLRDCLACQGWVA